MSPKSRGRVCTDPQRAISIKRNFQKIDSFGPHGLETFLSKLAWNGYLLSPDWKKSPEKTGELCIPKLKIPQAAYNFPCTSRNLKFSFQSRFTLFFQGERTKSITFVRIIIQVNPFGTAQVYSSTHELQQSKVPPPSCKCCKFFWLDRHFQFWHHGREAWHGLGGIVVAWQVCGFVYSLYTSLVWRLTWHEGGLGCWKRL